MEVNNNLVETLKMLKSCESNLNNFYLEAKEQKDKKKFKKMTKDLKEVENILQGISNKAVKNESGGKNSAVEVGSISVVESNEVQPPSKLPDL
jgi:hypothetical protein